MIQTPLKSENTPYSPFPERTFGGGRHNAQPRFTLMIQTPLKSEITSYSPFPERTFG